MHGDTIDHYLVSFVTVVLPAARWWRHEPFSGLLCHHVTFRITMVTPWTSSYSFVSPLGIPQRDGNNMEHFLVFCGTTRPSTAQWLYNGPFFGLVCRHEAFCSTTVTPQIIFCSFVSPWGLPQHNVVTINYFLVFCVTARSYAAQWWQHGPFSGIFCLCDASLSRMVTPWTILWSLTTARSPSAQWWHHGPFPGLLCHHEAFRSTMVTPWSIFWCFVSPQDLPQYDGDTMNHFLVVCVIARPFVAQWWHHEPFSCVLCHCEASLSIMATPWIILFSFVSPQDLP